MVKMWFVLLSNVIVRAPFMSQGSARLRNLSGSSLDDGQRAVAMRAEGFHREGLNTAPSDPPAAQTVMILPSWAAQITIMGCAGWAAIS